MAGRTTVYNLITSDEKIAQINSKKDLIILKSELNDRFGTINKELNEYLYAKLTENLISKCNFERVEPSELMISLTIPQEKSEKVKSDVLFKDASDISPNFAFRYKSGKITIIYNIKISKLEMYKNLSKFLEKELDSKIL